MKNSLILTLALIVFLIVLMGGCTITEPQLDFVRFGNTYYTNLSLGEGLTFKEHNIKLLKLKGPQSLVEVDGTKQWLLMAKNSLPTNFGNLRLFIADQNSVKQLSSDSLVHGLLKKEVFLAISEVDKPLLDPSKFIFPISRTDGFTWTMEEDSHLFAFLGLSPWLGEKYVRSHEGIDINMHRARGKRMDPLVAVEDGTITLVADSTISKNTDGCIILKSASQQHIYYIYQHTFPKHHQVKEGQQVKKGDTLGYIWGDHSWGHLHFSMAYRPDADPTYSDRYTNVLPIFPQMYELYHGNLKTTNRIYEKGNFTFGYPYHTVKNYLRRDAFNPNLGYGWELGDWCIPQKVSHDNDSHTGKGNVRLTRLMNSPKDRVVQCPNPTLDFVFKIAVKNGTYSVSPTVGDFRYATSQSIQIENENLGTFNIPADEYKTLDPISVSVEDGNLEITLTLTNENAVAGLRSLRFEQVNP